MKKFFLILLLTNLSLWAKETELVRSDPLLIPWLVVSLVLLGVLFWAMNRALKSREAKYRYIITVVFVLLVLLIFI
jgi:hypothetical protein